MTTSTQTGDLDIARFVLRDPRVSDDFSDGHKGLDAEEYFGDAPASEPGVVSIYLNGEVVENLLIARGWQRQDLGRETCAWIAPDGEKIWHRDEALTLALTAEAC